MDLASSIPAKGQNIFPHMQPHIKHFTFINFVLKYYVVVCI